MEHQLPDDMPLPDDHTERMRVARAVAGWNLGDKSWANLLVGAYHYPRNAAAQLDAEMEDTKRRPPSGLATSDH